jgi:hypothetical protein
MRPKHSRHERLYGQWRQAESAFSRHKRLIGSSLGGCSDASRERECQLRMLTQNLMLLAAHTRWFQHSLVPSKGQSRFLRTQLLPEVDEIWRLG